MKHTYTITNELTSKILESGLSFSELRKSAFKLNQKLGIDIVDIMVTNSQNEDKLPLQYFL